MNSIGQNCGLFHDLNLSSKFDRTTNAAETCFFSNTKIQYLLLIMENHGILEFGIIKKMFLKLFFGNQN